MTDIFHEVDEEVRREQLKKLWDRYGNHLLVLAVLVVIAVGGWRGYEYWQARKAAEAGAAFEQAMSLVDAGKHQEAEATFARIMTDGTQGYRSLARLQEAGAVARRDPKAAVAAYDALAVDSTLDQKLRELAALRAGFILVDSATLDEMNRRIEPLAGPNGAFRHSARELLALTAWRMGDVKAVRRWSDVIMADAETPASIRNRTEMLLALVPASAGS